MVAADSAVKDFPELAKCTAMDSDHVVGKMSLTFLNTSERSTNLTYSFPKTKTKKATTEAVNLRPN